MLIILFFSFFFLSFDFISHLVFYQFPQFLLCHLCVCVIGADLRPVLLLCIRTGLLLVTHVLTVHRHQKKGERFWIQRHLFISIVFSPLFNSLSLLSPPHQTYIFKVVFYIYINSKGQNTAVLHTSQSIILHSSVMWYRLNYSRSVCYREGKGVKLQNEPSSCQHSWLLFLSRKDT